MSIERLIAELQHGTYCPAEDSVPGPCTCNRDRICGDMREAFEVFESQVTDHIRENALLRKYRDDANRLAGKRGAEIDRLEAQVKAQAEEVKRLRDAAETVALELDHAITMDLSDSRRRMQSAITCLRRALSQPEVATACVETLERCAAGMDGDCSDARCPQARDGEPGKSGRSCPLYDWNDPDARF